MARGRPPKKLETALTKFHEAANLRADEIMAVVPQACEAIAPSERRPIAIAGRVIDMVAIEGLARIGLTYEEVLRKLRLKQSDLDDRPDVVTQIREACDFGSIDLIEGFKRDLVNLSATNPVSNTFALKALCPEQYDEKVRREKNRQSGQNAQDVLTGLLSLMVEERKQQKQEILYAIAEQRAVTQSNKEAFQSTRNMPQLGERNEVTGKPIVTVEPIDAIDVDVDDPNQSPQRVSLQNTVAAEALQKAITKMTTYRPDSEAPSE
jgi:hypothetical protein